MDYLWRAGECNVARVREEFDDSVAYTTLMTTLDRLYKKGLLTRRKVGRAFFYAPAASRQECEHGLAADVLEGLLAQHRQTPVPLLSNLVDVVTETDRALLDELDRLVREKRARLRMGDPS
jgi:predicted transcriptional regulator